MSKKILFYDIETTPLKAYIWRLGEQVVRHGQLIPGSKFTDVICIAYAWNDGKPAKVMDWGYDKQNSKPMLKAFDELIKQADVVIGKNSDRFDNKHLNTLRMIHGHAGMPDWIKYTDDLEKHMRKNFALPSNSLDYISDLLGLGGKVKMEFSDWIDIVERKDEASFKKMLKYNRKDVEDTRHVWEYCERHFEPKYKHPPKNPKAIANDDPHVCTHCGSQNLMRRGVKRTGGTSYQTYFCRDHHGYGGRKLVKVHDGEGG